MSRSSKKGSFVEKRLLAKVLNQPAGARKPIKTWARSSQIPPEFVGHTFLVHTGRDFKEVFVSEAMVGHRLGEFAPTRTFRGHGKMTKRVLTKA